MKYVRFMVYLRGGNTSDGFLVCCRFYNIKFMIRELISFIISWALLSFGFAFIVNQFFFGHKDNPKN